MCVAVLQLLQLKYSLYKKSKINSIFIYKYRSIFRVWERLHENCNTATLQQRVQSRSLLQLCRAPAVSTKSTLQTKCTNLIRKKNQKKINKTFMNRNGNVVTLHSELKAYPAPPKGREVSPL